MRKLPKRSDHQHSEATPHFDGTMDRIINDPTSDKAADIGVHVNEEFSSEKNPYDLKPKKDSELERFQTLMKGKEKNKKA